MKDILIGMAVGDAVGVPYEFIPKEQMLLEPCTDMIGYGVHNQPIGTWSDDSSMAFCMVESLIKGWNLHDMAHNYIKWFREGYWTPHGVVFDMGSTTQIAIKQLEGGTLPPNMCGLTSFNSNGNGSVMRMLPIMHYFLDKKVELSINRYRMVSDLSSMTHGHPLSVMSCFLLTEFARNLYINRNFTDRKGRIELSINSVALEIGSIKGILPFDFSHLSHFDKFFNPVGAENAEKVLSGKGFCVDTVISAVNCLLYTDNYRDAVLMAINLGDDTDTTACVTGGLAGILYGIDGIPTEWVENLVRSNRIFDLAERYDGTRG